MDIKCIELVQEKTTFGRHNDCNFNVNDLLESSRTNEISNIHFSIIKNNIDDPLSPVFLEVTHCHRYIEHI